MNTNESYLVKIDSLTSNLADIKSTQPSETAGEKLEVLEEIDKRLRQGIELWDFLNMFQSSLREKMYMYHSQRPLLSFHLF